MGFLNELLQWASSRSFFEKLLLEEAHFGELLRQHLLQRTAVP
jgi:hypothetical protein